MFLQLPCVCVNEGTKTGEYVRIFAVVFIVKRAQGFGDHSPAIVALLPIGRYHLSRVR